MGEINNISPDSADIGQRMRVMYTYAALAVLSLIVFGVLQVFTEDNARAGYLELAGASTILIILCGLKLTGNLALARFNFLLTISILLVVMLITGGTDGTGIFWFFMFPVSAFFLAGKREGVWWMTWLFIVIVGVWSAGRFAEFSLYYADIILRQLAVTLLVVSVGLYVYQSSRESWEKQAKASEQELRTYLRQMEAMHDKIDRAKSEFVTLASHQLRTPISVIRWCSEMLLSGDAGKLRSTQQEYVQGIYDNNQRQATIVDAMLLVSSLELGTLYIRPEPIDLPTLAKKLLKEEIKKNKKQLVIHEDYDDIPKLQLDTHLIRQVLRNLFSNAIKYTPSGGKIIIHINQSDEKLTPKSRGSIKIAVQDTGYGIPTAEQPDVFAKLFRAANIKTKDVDGTGLGLYIVKTILGQVGGRIQFTSQENEGSEFTVLLPLEGMADRLLSQVKPQRGPVS